MVMETDLVIALLIHLRYVGRLCAQPVAKLQPAIIPRGKTAAHDLGRAAHGVDIALGQPPVEYHPSLAESIDLVAEHHPTVGIELLLE